MNDDGRKLLASLLIFQNDGERSDILDPRKTQDDLCGMLLWLVYDRGYCFEVTAANSDHSNDLRLGPHGHTGGYAVDGWPLNSRKPGDYMDENSDAFAQFIQDCDQAPHRYQIGLGGSADTWRNERAGGPSVFSDNGSDHVHLGTR